MYKLVGTILVSALLFLAGCATIVGSDTQRISINSTPAMAKIKIVDENGTDIFDGQTPVTVLLEKSTGHFFGGKSYTITISKNGYVTQFITITHYANNWYKFGNIFPAGPIGYFAVDPFHGAMYNLTPAIVNVTLSHEQTSN